VATSEEALMPAEALSDELDITPKRDTLRAPPWFEVEEELAEDGDRDTWTDEFYP
jgi:hypothetical protein